MTMVLGMLAILLAVLLLTATVRHDARTGDNPTGAATTLTVLVAAVAVIVLFTTGIGLVGLTGLLSIAADS